MDLVLAQGKGGHQPLLLLVVQPAQGAVVLLRDARRLKDVVFQLLYRIRQIHHQQRDQEHPFIPALQILQQRFGLRAEGHKV